MAQKKYSIRPVNKVFIIWLFTALILFAGVTCSFSYAVRRNSIMLQCEGIMGELFELYREKVYGFSNIYVPVFQSDTYENMMYSYFEREGEEVPSARERADLVELLGRMLNQDEDIVFIGLYNSGADYNYCMIYGENTLSELWPDIPKGNGADTESMQLLGRYTWQKDNMTKSVFLIKGSAFSEKEDSCILVGYDADIFDKVVLRDTAKASAIYLLSNESGVIYDSEEIPYTGTFDTDWISGESGYDIDPQGKLWVTGSIRNNGRIFTAAYLIPWWKVFFISNQDTPLLLLLLAGFAVIALLLYFRSTRQIFQKVEWIQNGLETIGSNRLDYRLQLTGMDDEFDGIAQDINIMTERLETSIEQEYQMRIRQKWNELYQIQSRFNPHFLYNTLEVIRGKLFQNGDLENADYIEKLSRIFRNLTDAEPVSSIREEIAFCSLYMALLQLRYQDAVDVEYDIDPQLQECGILTHLIQPVIENYFVHAMSENNDWHVMEIICEKKEGGRISFTIADNGTGIPEEKRIEINQNLKQPDMKAQGYGLASIARRIRLFYGEDCGIELEKNQPCGIRVIITILEMSRQEHLMKMGIYEP